VTSFLVLLTSITLNDLEPSKWGILVFFFAFYRCCARFMGELQQNGWRYTKTICEHAMAVARLMSFA